MRPAVPNFLELFDETAVLRWAINLRWVFLPALLVILLLLTIVGVFTPGMYSEIAAIGLVVFAYNLVFMLTVRGISPGDKPGRVRLLRWAQAPPDLLVLTVVLHITGGATTPFPVAYVFFVVVAVLLIPNKGTYIAACEATFCYVVLVLLELTVLPPSANLVSADLHSPPVSPIWAYAAHLLSVVVVLWGVAYIADYLTQRIKAGESVITSQVSALTLLHRFGDNLNTAPDLESALQYIADELDGILHADIFTLLLLNDPNHAELRVVRGMTSEEAASYQRRLRGDGNPLLLELLNGGEGISAADLGSRPDLRSRLVRPTLSSFYTFPLHAEDKVVGLIGIGFNSPYNMPRGTHNLITDCSRQAGLMIDRTLLYQEAERAVREMSSLYHIGLATSSSLEIDSVMRQVADQVQAVMEVDSFLLVLYDAGNQLMDYVIQRDKGVEFAREVLPISSGGASAWIVQHRRPLLVRHWDQEAAGFPFVSEVLGDPTQSYLGVPLVAGDRVIGVISAQKREPYAYDANDSRLLSAIAAQAALALENARLHQATRYQALHDSLTGAYNHAALLEQIAHEVGTARDYRHPTTLIMLDIDHFKTYNDTYGHVAGDIVLRRVVEGIQANIKSSDALGRWGGEEFGVVLPGVRAGDALAIAQRIRKTLAALDMTAPDGRPLPAPTVSQGIACYPDTAGNSSQLVDQADSALYQAKARGRDTIVTWERVAVRARGVLESEPAKRIRGKV